jgi:hypothetical protein
MFLYLSVSLSFSPIYLSISPKPNLKYACLLTHSPARRPLYLSISPSLSIQRRNSLLLSLIFGWTTSFLYKYRFNM